MQARLIAASIMAVALAGGAVTAADAAPKRKPKPISGSKKVSDPTPDVTGSNPQSGAGCDTMLPPDVPQEAPFSLKIPGPGKLSVSIDNKLDWALEVRDSKGTSLTAADGTTPTDMESLSLKIKKAGTYKIHACNLGGEPEVTMTYRWTPA